ncbi:MAG: peptidase [Phycisphaerales bacterium]|nr:peptidase [Phycisphaerales bacterium]
MAKPRIGITMDYVTGKPHYMLPWTYAEAVEKAGGLPLMLPYRSDLSQVPHYLDGLDGVVLSGGDDLDPSLFGEERHAMARAVDPDRQKFEFALLTEIERRATPVLGICLGSQLMNVHRGGSLYQFLPDMDRSEPLEHRRIGDDWGARHGVSVEPKSNLSHLLGKTQLECNTSHKQSVHKPGHGLRVVATAPDGVIEATEDPSFPFYIGVQWHPERQNDEADHLKLFQGLVSAATRRAGT